VGQKQLNDYLREVKDKPFRWGEHDCLIFSNNAFAAYHGFGYAEEWFGRYSRDGKPKKTADMRQEFGVEFFDEMIGSKLTQISHIPPKGAIVATSNTAERHCAVRFIPYALGISVGTKAAFLSPNGVLYLPLDDVAKAWVYR
jgi:hypothetical protein